MPTEIENLNPNVYSKCKERPITKEDIDESIPDPFDTREIFGNIFAFSLLKFCTVSSCCIL